MEKYFVNFNTGAGNCNAETLEKAKQLADEGAAYTQENIDISCDGKIVAARRWYGIKYDADENYQEKPITFGDFGFYADWDEA